MTDLTYHGSAVRDGSQSEQQYPFYHQDANQLMRNPGKHPGRPLTTASRNAIILSFVVLIVPNNWDITRIAGEICPNRQTCQRDNLGAPPNRPV